MIPNAFKNTFYQLPANIFINGWRRLTPCWYGISTVYTTKRGRDERRKLTQRRFSSSGGWQGTEFPAALSAAVFRRSFQFRNALKVFIYPKSQMREVDHSDIFRQAIAIGPTGPIVDSNISSSSTRILGPSLRLHVSPDKIPLDGDNNATTHTYIILHGQQKTCYTLKEGLINITQLALKASWILGTLKFERKCIVLLYDSGMPLRCISETKIKHAVPVDFATILPESEKKLL